MGSALLDCAYRAVEIPAGGALMVDRVKFSELVEAAEVAARPNIEVAHGEVCADSLRAPWSLPAGPLCSYRR